MGFDFGRLGLGVVTGGLSEVPHLLGKGLNTLAPDPKRPEISQYQVSNFPQQAGMVAQNQANQMVAPQVQGAQIDQGNANVARGLGAASRAGQTQAAFLLRDAANGMAPSAAQAQLQQGNDAAMRQQLALANGARGGAAASMQAMHGAAQNQVQLGAANANASAMLRAQEMGQARGQFADQTNAMRGADMQQQQLEAAAAGQQAQLDQGAAQGNQQAQLGVLGLQANANQNAVTNALDMEKLRMQAQYDPYAIQANMYEADRDAGAKIKGGVLNALGGGLEKGLG